MSDITFSIKENLLCIVAFFVVGWLLSMIWMGYTADNVYMEGSDDIPREFFFDNIKFTLMPYEDLQNVFEVNYSTLGVAWFEYDNETGNWTRVISMAYLAREDQFLKVCNHEVMHHVFTFPNKTTEEEYVRALDNYVRFPVCNRLYSELISEE